MIPDFIDLIEAFLRHKVHFMVVGGYAVGIYGYPRATKDLDVWVEPSVNNAPRVIEGLRDFGAPLWGLTEQDFATAGPGLQIGVPPGRIDIITRISGVEFAQAWSSRLDVVFFGRIRCPVIGLDSLLANKRASGRLQDLADIAALEQIRAKG